MTNLMLQTVDFQTVDFEVCEAFRVAIDHDEPICASCLTKAIRLPFDRVLDAWVDIRRRGDLPIAAGQCSVCSTRGINILHPRP